MTVIPWKVSLHGGHSGEFCDHAVGTLEDVLEAAVRAGFRAFGISEHAPRLGARYLYERERELGWDVAHVEAMFEAYAERSRELVEAFSDRLMVIRGFETEVVPGERFAELMLGYKAQHGFDFMVGSVHHIDDISIDGPKADFELAISGRGGLEPLAIAYYERVAEMVEALNPEVVGHLDLIRKNGVHYGAVDTPAIRRAAEGALEVIRDRDAIIDLNTAAIRKGLGAPYPEPWLLERVKAMGLGVCFGDDSHGPGQVGEGVETSRRYLLEHGIAQITALLREDGEIVRRNLSLV